MGHYKSHLEQSDSGVPWIGQAPEHWKVLPLKALATYNDDTISEATPPDCSIRYVDISSVSYGQGIMKSESMMFADAPSRARRKARTGDVIISTVRTYLKAVASVDHAHADCVYSTGFAVLRPRPEILDPTFLKWLALNDLLIQAVESHSEGLSYPAINASTLVDLKTLVPPIVEQRAIATFLDRETARIDALIGKKERFIELLKEKRAAVITHAVTQGLDPSVPMKDSEVEWLGKVPAHWSVTRLRFCTELNPSFKEQKPGPEDRLVPFFPMEAIGEKGELDRSRLRPVNEVKTGYSYFAEGDVVIAKVTPCFENGKGAVMFGLQGGFGFGTTEITVLRCGATIDREFLYLLTTSWPVRKIGVAHMTGAGGLKRVPDNFFRDLEFGLPRVQTHSKPECDSGGELNG